MRAALLLISLLFGVPMPDMAQADPAAESGAGQYIQARPLQAAIDSGQQLHDAAFKELAASVGSAWRAEFRQLVDRTASLIQRAIAHPTLLNHTVHFLSDDAASPAGR